MSWGNQHNLKRNVDGVTVLLAGAVERVNTWYSTLATDSRFRVTSFATDPEDFQAKL